MVFLFLLLPGILWIQALASHGVSGLFHRKVLFVVELRGNPQQN